MGDFYSSENKQHITACKQYCLAAGATQGNIAYTQNVIGKRKSDTTTIKRTDNYRNIRSTYKLNSGLFSDTTAQRFVFYFFCRPAFFKNNFSQPHKWHIWFCPDTQSQPFGKTKEPLFADPHKLYLS